MLKVTAADLMRKLEREGLGFRSFALVHEGDYTVDDADWNYKDVPHLHYIHQLVEAHPAAMDDKFIATLNIQKVLGMRLPLTIFNYESGVNEQTYFTSFAFFVLVIRTCYESLGELRCRVTTTYSFGAPPWMLFLFPLIKWILKRNYADLMSGDIPMRTRRGQLRAWGARFIKPGPSYSFQDTTNIAKKNVIFPSEVAREKGQPVVPTLTEELIEVPGGDMERFLGRSDEFGIRVIASEGYIVGFPRAGACLDGPRLANGQVQCPWHGKRILPLFKLRRMGTPCEAEVKLSGQYYRVRFDGKTSLSIAPVERNPE
jgi:hypothetical protein